jgi:hypothetical protein
MGEVESQIKGTTFVNLVKYVKERRGQQGVEHIFSILKKEAPKLYIPPDSFKTRDMYPEVTLQKLLEIVDREYGKGDLKECYKFGLYDANNLGVLGFFISFKGDPQYIIQKAPRSWYLYHNTGELRISQLEPGLGVIEVWDNLKSKALCHEMLGYYTGAAKQTKGKNIRVEETRCRCKGDPVCEFTFKWDEK